MPIPGLFPVKETQDHLAPSSFTMHLQASHSVAGSRLAYGGGLYTAAANSEATARLSFYSSTTCFGQYPGIHSQSLPMAQPWKQSLHRGVFVTVFHASTHTAASKCYGFAKAGSGWAEPEPATRQLWRTHTLLCQTGITDSPTQNVSLVSEPPVSNPSS